MKDWIEFYNDYNAQRGQFYVDIIMFIPRLIKKLLNLLIKKNHENTNNQ
jgi:hypothetical protein